MAELEFGEKVAERAEKLAAEGRDANQIAKILCDEDAEASNYGIGIVLQGDGTAYPTSPTLLRYVLEETQSSTLGTYKNSMSMHGQLRERVLQWQRVPREHWEHFSLVTPSDAGTGAVKTAVELAAALRPSLKTLGIEELGWPAYRAIATSVRLGVKEYPTDSPITGADCLALYQAGPMNTTGEVASAEMVAERAGVAAADGNLVVLDRAYSGFELARRLEEGYDRLMAESYERFVAPFVEQGVPFLLAISPTKAFGSFALRPAGLLLAYTPDSTQKAGVQQLMNTLMRARGSSFEHPSTRGLVRALVEDLDGLEVDHQGILRRVASAEAMWVQHAGDTGIGALFGERYAGLFRNPPASEHAAEGLYGEHLYPVLSNGRCRINITGISGVDEVARQHVAAFGKHVIAD